MKCGKRKYRFLIIVVFCIAGVAVFTFLRNKQHTMLASSIKSSVQIDVYFFAKKKQTFFTSLQYSNGIYSIFGDENVAVFGSEVSINDLTSFTYPADGGILLRFQYPDSIITLDAYCHAVVDPALVDDGTMCACFMGTENEKLYLVETSIGVKLSEPSVRTVNMGLNDGQFFEISDKAFFSDIISLLVERFHIDC